MILFFLFIGFASATFFQNPLPEVTIHNDALSFQGLRSNVYGLYENEATTSNPLIFFGLKVHATYPSVDNLVDGLHPPRVLWGWAYDTAMLVSQGSLNACGDVQTLLTYVGHTLDIYGYSELDGLRRKERLSNGVWQLSFSESEWRKAKKLALWIHGRITLQYLQREYTVVCRSTCSNAGCGISRQIEEKQQSRDFFYESASGPFTYSVVHPNGTVVFFAPFAQKRSLKMPWLDVFFFSNTSLNSWAFFSDNQRIASERYFSFNVMEDEWGVRHAQTIPSNEAFHPVPVSVSDFISSRFSYAKKLRVEESKVGPSNYAFAFQDVFGNVYSQNVSVITRDVALLFLNLSNEQTYAGQSIQVEASLTNGLGRPLVNHTLRFVSPNEVVLRQTGPQGRAPASFTLPAGVHGIEVYFDGSLDFPPAYSRRVVSVLEPHSSVSATTPKAFEAVFLLALLILGLSFSAWAT